MKHTIYIALAVLILLGCKQTATTSEGEIVSQETQKKLEPLAPENPVEKLRTSNAYKPEPQQDVAKGTIKVSPNNRFELLLDKQQVPSESITAETQIKSNEKGRMDFGNGWSLHYWMPEIQTVLGGQEGEDVRVSYEERFVQGVILRSIQVIKKDRLPVLSIVALGSGYPIVSNFNKGLIVAQQEEEKEFVDNESEKINMVVTTVSKEIVSDQDKPLEVQLENGLFQVTVNKSLRYYHKSNDSAEGPPYILEYTVTRIK